MVVIKRAFVARASSAVDNGCAVADQVARVGTNEFDGSIIESKGRFVWVTIITNPLVMWPILWRSKARLVKLGSRKAARTGICRVTSRQGRSATRF